MIAEPPPPPRGTWPKAIPLLVLAGLLAYANSFTKAFVLDDLIWIAGNPDLADAGRYLPSLGRPVVAASILLNHRLGGLNPTGYHAFNLAVHILAGLTLYGLVRRTLLLPRWGGRYETSAPFLAFAVALLWLVHPLQTQAVTYIIQRCESMMGLFYLFTLYAWLRGATGGGRGWYPVAVASFALSCGCKEVAVTLPPMLLAFDRVFLSRSWRELARARWLPYLGILAVWGVYFRTVFPTAAGDGAAVGIGFGLQSATPYQYLLTESEVILHYLRLSVWPVHQALDYLDWPIAPSLRAVWPAFAAVSALLLAGLVLLYRRPAAGFVVIWFFAILAPTSSIMPIIDPAFEHRMYLSLAAVVVAAVFAGDALLRGTGWPDRKKAAFATVALAAAVLPLIGLTFARNETYRTSLVAEQAAAAARPDNPRPWAIIADRYLALGEVEAADAALRHGEGIDSPFNAVTPVQRAAWLMLVGRLDEAESRYRALTAGPYNSFRSPQLYKVLAWVLIARGKPAEAATLARTLVERQPQVAANHLLLASAELAAGHATEARAAAAEAVRLDPASPRTSGAAARAPVLAREPRSAAFYQPQALWMIAAACLADGDRDPQLLDTLAMAWAWNGDYAKAADAAHRGIAAAEARGDADWAAALRTRLKLYEAGKPYANGG